MGESQMTRYVVAVSEKEAQELIDTEAAHESRVEAYEHLAHVKAPPTDPFYAGMYRVWKVTRGASE